MKAWGIVNIFLIFRVIKVARIFKKKLGHDAYGVK